MKEVKKLLIIGCGGIGSWLIHDIYTAIEHEQINPAIEITIADNDMVELEQVRYQNFKPSEAGMSKVRALAKRYKIGLIPWEMRIKSPVQLLGYDFIILCVDNDYTRRMVYQHCFLEEVEFIDLRARGRVISAFPKINSLDYMLPLTDPEDMRDYSCQDEAKIAKGMIDYGNRIVATIGLQIFLNNLRGMTKKLTVLSI